MSWLVAKKRNGNIIAWVYRYKIGQKEKQKSTGKKARSEAVKIQKHWDAFRHLYGCFPGEQPEQTDESIISEQVERFLMQKSFEIKSSTVTRYRAQFSALLQYFSDKGVSRVEQLSTTLLNDYKFHRLALGKAHKTVFEELLCLRSMIRSLVAEEAIEKDPVRIWPELKKRIPAKPERLGPYSDDEVVKLLAYLSEKKNGLYPVAMTAFYAGLRIGELRGLKVSDINFATGAATVFNQKSIKDTKSAYRQISLHPDLLSMLSKKCKCCLPGAYVFPELRAHAISWPVKQLHNACKALDIQYRRFHGCRHTFATKAANSGIGLPKVQAQLGHTNLATTQQYIRQHQIDHDEIRLVDFGK